MEDFVIEGKARTDLGSRASARIRERGLLPVNVYGHRLDNRNLSVDYKVFERFFAQGHRMLTIEVDGGREHGVVREIQYDNLGTTILHVDLARVDREERIIMNIPVETVGIPKGLSAGGTLDIALKELHVEGPAGSLPEVFEVPVGALELGAVIRIADLAVPEGCEFRHSADEIVLAVHEPRKAAGELEGEGVAESSTMPEVITRKKETEEGDAKDA
jgi:large subunit ribosomal protein L25